MLWVTDLWVILLGTLAAFLAAIETGFRLGLRYRGQGDETAKNHVDALQSALLVLLALLLGFTFAMSVSRFDTRKSLVLEEANAIGTADLRAQILPPAQRQEVRKLLNAYVAARLDFDHAGIDLVRLRAANAAASRIGNRIWAVAAGVAEKNQTSEPAGLLLQTLNEVIDLQEKRQVALDNHVPETVIYLLLAVSVGSLGFISYGAGLMGRRRHGSTAVFALLVALVLMVILDLDRPRRGLIRVSQDSLIRVKAALEQGMP